jgi:hypothetical protein
MMRRGLWLLGLIGLGVLVGFLVRLLLPRVEQVPVYEAPVADPVSFDEVSAERRSA